MYSEPGFVSRQYYDASNLNARITLHRCFSTNEQPWQRWVFDRLELPPVSRILELGCGPGDLWIDNLDRTPEGWGVALTDASPGMLREAAGRLQTDQRFAFRVVDAQEIPFEDESFDAVIANGMLYHVPDKGKALSEMARVLGPGGRLYATTNGRNHHREMGRMLRFLDPRRPDDAYYQRPLGFSLENGAEQLSRWFSEVAMLRREDALAVTETKPLVDYLLSGTAADAVQRELDADEFGRRVSKLTAHLERELASGGEIRITKDAGMLVARK